MSEYLRIMQAISDTKLIEICELEVDDGSFKRIGHMPILRSEAVGNVWIDLVSDDGDILSDAPHHVSPYHGRWLLGEFFRLPDSIVDRVKLIKSDVK